MTRRISVVVALAVAGCSGERAPEVESTPYTYYADAKAIVDRRCATCHRPGDIGPFPLTTFDEVKAFAGAVRSSVANGTMPPWQPSDDCNSYKDNFDLTTEEKDILLDWLDGNAPAGDPATAPAPVAPRAPAFEPDVTLQLPDPYTPKLEPDDYHCQLVPWPEEETRYVTGLRVIPDQRAIVHHVIVFLAGPDQVEQFRALDEAEEGPGYTCYGGPTGGQAGEANVDIPTLLAALNGLGLTVADLRAGNYSQAQLAELLEAIGASDRVGRFSSLGSWVPGVPDAAMPSGTGIKVEPGSMLVIQVHYNTRSSDPVADQSRVEIATAPSVEREAIGLPMVDLGWVTNGMLGQAMTIPAGASEVQHSTTLTYDSVFLLGARRTLGLPDDAPLVVHRATHHMHELGTRARTELRHPDGSSTCVLENPDWDFSWQGAYQLQEPLTIRPDDEIWMRCTWDNSAANQPIIDGQVRAPAQVAWGEGTSDEMCLGSLYVTAE